MTTRNKKSGGEVAEQLGVPTGKLAKTDARYWQARVFHDAFTRDGRRVASAEFSARMQHLGRRETFSLNTPNRAAAGVRARDLYLHLVSSGWEATLAKFKPGMIALPVNSGMATVGEFIEDVIGKSSIRARTVEGYARALRKIVADVQGINGGMSKFDYHSGGRQKWLDQINAVSLATLTPDRIQQWKLKFIRNAGASPVRQREARTSANAFLRNARSLFSVKLLRFVSVKLPDPLPFAGVEFEPRASMRYRSEIDAPALVRSARAELAIAQPEVYKVFLLAVMAGLRRGEIDLLEWAHLDYNRGLVRVQASAFLAGKSEDTFGDVEVDPELLEILREFQALSHGPFVLDSDNAPRPEAKYAHYRCQKHFEVLIRWLREKGVKARKPVHTLRKEFGALMADVHGIYVASRALRHAEIGITSQHYLDKKRRATVGLGELLVGAEKLMAASDPGEGTP